MRGRYIQWLDACECYTIAEGSFLFGRYAPLAYFAVPIHDVRSSISVSRFSLIGAKEINHPVLTKET